MRCDFSVVFDLGQREVTADHHVRGIEGVDLSHAVVDFGEAALAVDEEVARFRLGDYPAEALLAFAQELSVSFAR